ncbi:dTDP-4-dehydrorhamnose 3,5-epimerase [Brevundimonas sp. TWP2-3-2]|uniref:dTDP-4-dehydrorhamnose 3,5-epimerase n=1 Tax=unclassified Brevundimonas TaxID=2622653 RepID=UPI003CF44489
MSKDVKLIEVRRFGDARGWFSETYAEAKYAAMGVDVRFVQDNQSYSALSGTIRGIHFQTPPHAQAKLVRCVRGSIVDYAVDLRKGSPTYGQVAYAELSAENGRQLFVPVGFGHAFVTLELDTEVAYKVSAVYAGDCDGGVAWDCPEIGIDWPLPETGPVLSAKDKVLSRLADFDSPFVYDGVPMAATGDLG